MIKPRPVSPLMTPAEVCTSLRIDADTLDQLRITDKLKTFAIDAHLIRFDRQSVLAFTLGQPGR